MLRLFKKSICLLIQLTRWRIVPRSRLWKVLGWSKDKILLYLCHALLCYSLRQCHALQSQVNPSLDYYYYYYNKRYNAFTVTSDKSDAKPTWTAVPLEDAVDFDVDETAAAATVPVELPDEAPLAFNAA